MNAEEMQNIVDVCKMLGDPTRVGIMEILAKGPKSVGALCDALDLPQPGVSHHLGLLRMSRLVTVERDGKKRIHSLNRKQLAPLKKFLAKLK